MKKTLILSFLFVFTLAITTPALAATMDQEPVKTEQKKEDKKKKECNKEKSCEEKKACTEKKACCSEKKEKKG
ncbi:hypothetical protein KDU71_08115 [Carboxylicivirga sediminis]|uniref:Uncharacterized protein n=1 Tax=Carboxylicivirga sediminis TaxID=2006564 RepID=A0A941F2E5_9BACT|nr:hypothetical protein [Carboxylicivirga sediminis]MBR8535521.1 hypothetical protein [Carboxylicivirga sediminis]